MIQQEFAAKAKTMLKPDDNVIGLAVAGSWLAKMTCTFYDESKREVLIEKI